MSPPGLSQCVISAYPTTGWSFELTNDRLGGTAFSGPLWASSLCSFNLEWADASRIGLKKTVLDIPGRTGGFYSITLVSLEPGFVAHSYVSRVQGHLLLPVWGQPRLHGTLSQTKINVSVPYTIRRSLNSKLSSKRRNLEKKMHIYTHAYITFIYICIMQYIIYI